MMTRQMLSTVSNGSMPVWRPARRRIISASRPGRKAEPDTCVFFTAISVSMMRPRSIRRSCIASSIRSISRRKSASVRGGVSAMPGVRVPAAGFGAGSAAVISPSRGNG